MKDKKEICYFQNPGGPRLSWSQNSGMKLIEKDGLRFKDLAHDFIRMRTGDCLRKPVPKTWPESLVSSRSPD